MRTIETSGGADAISAAAISCDQKQQRQHLAEPLWFAVMCRAVWGPNAAKELQFELDRSERTARSWASGDVDPPSTILANLLRGDHGGQVLNHVMDGSTAQWWLVHQRERRLAAIAEQLREQLNRE